MKYNQQKSSFQPLKRVRALTRAKPEQRGKASSALGNATELCTPPEKYTRKKNEYVDFSTGESLIHGAINQKDAVNLARETRYKLQDAAANILYGFHGSNVPVNAKGYDVHHRTCTCTKFRKSQTVDIVKSKTNGKAFFSGLLTCANSRTCPVCSAKITERKSNEMRVAFNIAKAQKLKISMITLTAPHNAGDMLDELKEKISFSNAKFWAGAPMRKFKNRFGVVGNIRSFEVRHGSNGWHPHFHIIIFSKIKIPTKQDNFDYLWLFNRWKTMVVRSGLNCPNEYGFDISNGEKAGEYITKFGSDDEFLETKTGKKVTWDMADEMTKGNTKTGRKKSSSPWDLLSNSIELEDKEERQKNKILFLHYARAFVGTTLIKWSKGLRAFFELGKDSSDEDIISQEEDKADFLCYITPEEWEFILKNKLRSVVCQLAENGGSKAIAQLLFNNEYDSFEEYYDNFSNRNTVSEDLQINTDNWISTENKSLSNPYKSKIKNEHKNHLITGDFTRINMNVFDRAIYDYKNKRGD